MRYTAVPRRKLTDLRGAQADADVTVEPASTTTTDAPTLTSPDVAPESSPAADAPAAEQKPASRKRRTRKAKA